VEDLIEPVVAPSPKSVVSEVSTSTTTTTSESKAVGVATTPSLGERGPTASVSEPIVEHASAPTDQSQSSVQDDSASTFQEQSTTAETPTDVITVEEGVGANDDASTEKAIEEQQSNNDEVHIVDEQAPLEWALNHMKGFFAAQFVDDYSDH
jgi:hypothetical protein